LRAVMIAWQSAFGNLSGSSRSRRNSSLMGVPGPKREFVVFFA
jgi:hypothetical protein